MKKWLLIYDIKNAKRLAKVMKIVSQYATRVQLSVYELEADEKFVEMIANKLTPIVKGDDSVIFFDICSTDWSKCEKFGLIVGLQPEESYYLL